MGDLMIQPKSDYGIMMMTTLLNDSTGRLSVSDSLTIAFESLELFDVKVVRPVDNDCCQYCH